MSAASYSTLVQVHVAFAGLFLLYYVVRTILLVSNNKAALARTVSLMKWPDRLVSLGFLVTGIWLTANTGNLGMWYYVKVLLIVASIPLAVIGFKRERKLLAVLSVLLLVYAYGISETKSPTMNRKAFYAEIGARHSATPLDSFAQPVPAEKLMAYGQTIYLSHCANCHGTDGKLAKSGAANLTLSAKRGPELVAYLQEKHHAMPSFAKTLTEEQRAAVAAYSYMTLGAGRMLK